MAELIERGKLLKSLATSREYHAASCRERNLLIRAEIIVREQPTTTEAEIRASAIDEFAELLLSKLDVDGRDWYCARKINEVAEELKEG